MKVLPELLKSVEFGGGGAKVFSTVMQIGQKLSDDEYETQIIPVVVRLFANPDRGIRVCLLDNLPLMIEHLPQKIVNDKIFPQMVSLIKSQSNFATNSGLGHWLHRRCTCSPRADSQGSAYDSSQTIRPNYQWRALATSCQNGKR
jgi:hypothetical protein